MWQRGESRFGSDVETSSRLHKNPTVGLDQFGEFPAVGPRFAFVCKVRVRLNKQGRSYRFEAHNRVYVRVVTRWRG